MTDAELDQAIIEKEMGKSSSTVMDVKNLSDDELDEMLAQKLASESVVPESRNGEAFVEGFGKTASFGYLPQIQAATEPIFDKVANLFMDDTDEKLKAQGFEIEEAPEESYVQRRDKFIRRGDKLAEENPMAYGSGAVAGGISSGIATGGGLTSLLGKSTRFAPLANRFVDAGKTGAAVGIIRNPGDTEGEVDALQVEERLKNAGKDALTGVVLQGGLETVAKTGKTIKNAGKNLKYWSQNKAFKASGADKPAFKKAILNKKNTDLGQTVLDEKLIKAGDDVRDIAKNAEKALNDSGKKLGEIYKKADANPGMKLRAEDARELSDEYISEASERLAGTSYADDVAEKVQKVLETLPKNPTFGQLKKWRSSIDEQINFAKGTKDLKPFQDELLHLRNKVQQKITEKIGKSSPELAKQFTRENKRFSNLSEISKTATQKSAATEGNTGFGIREGFGATLGGMAGSAIAGPLGTGPGIALGAITTNVLRKHATPFMAMTANKVARSLEANSPAIQKFSKPLIEAANHPEKFVAIVNALMKEPEFKRALEEANQGYYRGPAKK
jgi:uncharacterized protein (DUF697 family)